MSVDPYHASTPPGSRLKANADCYVTAKHVVRNWMSKNDPAFRPDFFLAFERARVIAVRTSIKTLRDSKDWKAHAFWLEKNIPEYARNKARG